ncbi:MAG: hypothetical protein A2Z20_09315 [Bdellovibrionales bacterium RBG_16_40_8]|nr:MAG: hypothetical protein A2Z20_09315 [Bdellovibrionales bacterium RBG_16_40_8]
MVKRLIEHIPIEVKLKEMPVAKDFRHLQTFIEEYKCPHGGFVICRAPRRIKITKSIQAIPWQELSKLAEMCE